MSKKVKKIVNRIKPMTAGDLSAVLATVDPNLRVIGPTLRDVFDLVPQSDGKTILIVERSILDVTKRDK